MAENQPAGLVGIMDQLWFQRGVLSSDPPSLISFKSFDGSPLPVFPKYPSCPSQPLFPTPLDEDSLSALPPLADQEFSSEYTTSSTSILEGEDSIAGDEDEQQETKRKEGERQDISKQMRRSSTGRVLEKSMSCKYVGELELEEIRGFMDLGFTFRKEHLSPWMTSLVPGLRRFESLGKKERASNLDGKREEEQEEEEEEEEETELRPYLSEAWTIKRPNSQLLSLKVPKLSSDADMKKHIKFWAKTVASEIQEES